MTNSQPAIEIRNLSFAYNDISVLCDVQLDIWPKDSACIVGPNGGGKTTLVRLILGLLTPNQGTVRLYGREPAEERTRIGYVPQYAQYDAYFPISVLDVVCMGCLGTVNFSAAVAGPM